MVKDSSKKKLKSPSVKKDIPTASKSPTKTPTPESNSDVEDLPTSEVDGETVKADPYLMAEAEYIKKDLRWRNKQRTQVRAFNYNSPFVK